MIDNLTAKDILLKYYSPDSELFHTLWIHSCQVAEKALEIAARFKGEVDEDFIYDAAILHDIGIFKTNAPDIYCTGTEPYIRHGIIGAELLRGLGLERHALVCERHTGAGLSCEEIVAQQLPLPHRDMLPVSLEEKIICYADKFFSKPHIQRIKTVDGIRKSMKKFGEAQLRRFDEMNELFNR